MLQPLQTNALNWVHRVNALTALLKLRYAYQPVAKINTEIIVTTVISHVAIAQARQRMIASIVQELQPHLL